MQMVGCGLSPQGTAIAPKQVTWPAAPRSELIDLCSAGNVLATRPLMI